jgi:hypothetical protein
MEAAENVYARRKEMHTSSDLCRKTGFVPINRVGFKGLKMSLSIGCAVFVYLLSVVCSLVIANRSSNWRIRLLAFTVGLLPLCQAVILLGRHQIWLSIETAEMAESLELLVGALCLTTIHLLNTENGDRKKTDARLRVAEATEPPSN